MLLTGQESNITKIYKRKKMAKPAPFFRETYVM